MPEPSSIEISEAFEIVRAGRKAGVILTCEHASGRLPEPWRWPPGDERLVGTHWAIDLGAGDLARELAQRMEAVAILSRFSRLLADPNRAEDEPSLFRDLADGAPVLLNTSIDPLDREHRLADYYRPFHAAIDAEVAKTTAHTLLSVHSFTDVYEGHRRWLEVGVLFDREEELGEQLVEAFSQAGFHVLPNEPYSGKDGLIHSAAMHAARRNLRAIEIEVRQDLAILPVFRARVVDVLARVLGG